MLKTLKLTFITCFFAGISLNPAVAVTIGNGTTVIISSGTYLSDVTFTGTPQENVTAVIQATTSRTLQIGDPDMPRIYPVNIASGNAGKVEVTAGNTLTFGGSLYLQGGGRLDLVGNFVLNSGPGQMGEELPGLKVTGSTLNLLAGTKVTTTSWTQGQLLFETGAVIGIAGTSGFKIAERVEVTGSTTLNLTGVAAAGNVFIETEWLDLEAGAIFVDASALDLSALAAGDALVLVSNTEGGDIWKNGTKVNTTLTAADFEKISLDDKSSRYFELEFSEGTQEILLRYSAPIPEPSTYAVMGAVCALGLVLLRRRKKTK